MDVNLIYVVKQPIQQARNFDIGYEVELDYCSRLNLYPYIEETMYTAVMLICIFRILPICTHFLIQIEYTLYQTYR
jgi:hypothetical protein